MQVLQVILAGIQWRSQPDNLVPLCKFQSIIIIHFFRNWLFSQSVNCKYLLSGTKSSGWLRYCRNIIYSSKYIRENNIWRHNWVAIKPHFMFTRKNIKIFPANFFGYDISFSNEYFCLLSLCCTSSFFYGYDFPCFFQNSNLNCLHPILLVWASYKSKLLVS